jgi:hypothetical protein
MSAELYAALPDLPAFPLGAGRELVCCFLTRSSRALPTASIRLLRGCQGFATLDEHASALSRALYLGPGSAAVRQELAALAEAGLLVSPSDLLASARQRCGPQAAPPKISSLGVPTRDNPDRLRTCMVSYADSASRFGRNLDFVVVDDSAEHATRAANRQVLDELRNEHGLRVRCAGPEDVDRFAGELAREVGLPVETVELALRGDARLADNGGAGRNALLLDSVGEMAVQVDDDTLCRLAAVPGSRDGLALFNGHDPTEFWFLAGAADRAAVGPAVEGDLAGLHERLLGRGLERCLAEATAAGLDVSRVNSGFFTRLAPGTGTVLATMAGVLGDCDLASPLSWLLLEGPSRSRLVRSESDYRAALASRQVLRGVTQPTLGGGSFCTALNLGLDNRRLLPPFFPVLPGHDAVFGAVLRGCCQGYVGFLPGALLHQSPRRSFTVDDLNRAAGQVSTAHVVQMFIAAMTPAPCGPEQALRALGAALSNVAALAPADFEQQVRLHVCNARSRWLGQLEEQLRRLGGSPTWWAADVQQVMARLRDGLLQSERCLPGDLCAAVGPDRAGVILQELVGQFGRLLQVWPDVVAAARCLRQRGVRLATSDAAS